MVSQKYVQLLQNSYERYKDLEVIINPNNSVLTSESSVENDSKTNNVRQNKELESKSKIHKKSRKPYKDCISKRFFFCKKFTPDEDQIILDAIKDSDVKDASRKLTKKLGRNNMSIECRIQKLLSGVTARQYKLFTLNEDLLIIDNVIESLKEGESLYDVGLRDIKNLSVSIGRHHISVYKRWDTTLRIWLLQFYNKTLNLSIETMLSTFLAENFDEMDKIDWNLVLSVQEFSGHTLSSLKRIFINILLRLSRHLGLKKTEIKINQLSMVPTELEFIKSKKDLSIFNLWLRKINL